MLLEWKFVVASWRFMDSRSSLFWWSRVGFVVRHSVRVVKARLWNPILEYT